MMRRLRKDISDNTKSKISLSKTGLMIYTDPTKLIKRIVVPVHLQAVICYMHHNMELSAHQGAKRATAAVSRSYYWPGIPTFVRKYVKSCSFCTRRKTSRKENAGKSIAQLSMRPGQVFQIDIWGPLPESEGGNVYLLTFMDTFLRWPGALQSRIEAQTPSQK